MLHVDMQGVNKWFGDLHVLRDITLGVARAERIVICGPSGSGKSTLIRCLNRLEAHQRGRIIVDGVELSSDLTKIDEVRQAWSFSSSISSRTSPSWKTACLRRSG